MIAPLMPSRDRRMVLSLVIPLVFAVFVAAAIHISEAETAVAFDPWWVGTHMETQLWSGQDSRAVSFGPVPKGSPFMVIEPQQGPRLHVQDPRTGGLAFIDAAAVGPVPPPRIPTSSPVPGADLGSPKRTPPTVPQGFQSFWISNWMETEFWAGSEPWAASLGAVPQFRKFLVVEPQKAERLKVWSPEKDVIGYLDQAAVGPVGPSAWLESHPLKVTGKVGELGRAVGKTAFVRNLPVVTEETELRHLPNNTAVSVLDKGVTTDGKEWYTVGQGEYVLASEVRLPTTPPAFREGKWIDADLAEPAMVTAYEGDKAIYSALAIIGTEATPTLRGEFRILRRVEKEVMDSETLGVPRDDPDGYFLEDVLYTQYFTAQGAAIHYNWWLGTFGQPGSHGCLGLTLADSEWFWDWAQVGTPVTVR